MKEYHYKPNIGQLVKLEDWNAYRLYAPTVTMWAWFQVKRIDQDNMVLLEHYNAAPTGNLFVVPLTAIQKPIGWQPRYTIYVEPAKLDSVRSWLPYGVAVRSSHDLSSAGSTSYQPLRDHDKPIHWQYSELTDTVQPEEITDRIKLVKYEENYTVGLLQTCQYCNGTGKVTSYHEPSKTIDCTCSNGLRIRYLSEMPIRDRKQAIKQLTADGWAVHYERRANIGYWATRETTVKEFGEPLPS